MTTAILLAAEAGSATDAGFGSRAESDECGRVSPVCRPAGTTQPHSHSATQLDFENPSTA